MSTLSTNQGIPSYSSAASPDFTGPLQAVVDSVTPKLGLVFADAAARDAAIPAPTAGMRAYLASTQEWSDYIGSGVGAAWVPRSWKRTRYWEGLRTTQDNFAALVFASIADRTIVSAPAGQYLISCSYGMVGSVVAIGNLRLTAGGVNLTGDIRTDISTAGITVSFTRGHTHPGGNMYVQALQYIAAGTGTLLAGSVITASFLGENP